ncbi:hypothetical protein [Duganella callida]|uniref:ATP-grasp domain-containing protein n=1 Tax=Duganella callida TaxID=2561932 RepID=A0A4Y9S2W9_9BURK|nr:hypothetical protein [Duganella callida]TFW15692.1 hypothetical protein E4L98_26040 [Duganella callida]
MAASYLAVLVIGVEQTVTRAAARCLRLAGHAPVVLAPRSCWRMKLGRDCRRLIFWSGEQPSAQQVQQVVSDSGIVAVLAADRATSLLLARHPELPAVPTPRASLIALLEDRWNLMRFADAAGLPVPAGLRIDSAAQLQADPLLYPMVTRPLRGDDISLHYSRGTLPAEYPLLAQVYVPGWKVGASFLARQGRLVACSVFRPARRGRHSFYHSRRVREYVEQFAAVSAYHGAGHLGMRYDPARDNYYVLSWKPGFDASLLAAARAGVNYPELLLRLEEHSTLILPSPDKVLQASPR